MDSTIAAKYRVSRLSSDEARARLQALGAQAMLGPGELNEAYALAEKLGIEIEVVRLDLTEGPEATWKPVDEA
jgi:PP-loop superfamily ATP-utilizing enzyme